jgi:hypothetical protein
MTGSDEQERKLSFVEVLAEAALGCILLGYEVPIVVPDLKITSQLIYEAAHIEVPGLLVRWVLPWWECLTCFGWLPAALSAGEVQRGHRFLFACELG